MTYPETVQYLESFINYEKIPAYPYRESLKLERIKNFLAAIDNPQDSLRCLHIAGTKGKGSTCAFLAHILSEAGFRVGLYTSPHLSDFRERIRVLSPRLKVKEDFAGMISKEELRDLIGKLKPAIENYNESSEYGPLSFFEVYTAAAFIHFKEQKVDFAVLETGLGGRLDATNAVSPLVCAITPISYEHTDKLGNRLSEIAGEKAGIIKSQNSIVISAPQEKEAIKIIRNRCKKIGVKLYEVAKDVTYRRTNNGFEVKGLFANYSNLKIRLLGEHQFINASLAIGVIEALRYYNIRVGSGYIRRGLYGTVWPGRCEVVSRSPLVVLDGAQNIASAGVLKNTIKENFKYKKLILILGISNDKDVKGICGQFYDLADTVILTQADNPRASTPESLAEYFAGKEAHITDNVREAKELAWRLAKKEDLILVTGSLFVVGEFRN
jgi:dihydrofolate synthase/folylpolyglutamate synthase